MENLEIVVKIVILMSAVLKSTSEPISGIPKELMEQCSSNKEMCNKEETDCLEQLGKLGAVVELFVRHEKVSKSRYPRPFEIQTHPVEAMAYAEKATYSVYRVNGVFWNFADSPLYPIKECCDVPLSENCTLPGFSENSTLIVGIPLKITTDSSELYAIMEIVQEDAPPYDLCDDQKKSRPCVYISKDGKFNLRRIFTPLSISDIALEADYCFFSAPNETESLVKRDGKLTFHGEFPQMKIGEDCDIVEGGTENPKNLIRTLRRVAPDEVICSRMRFPKHTQKWTSIVRCFIAEEGELEKPDTTKLRDEEAYFIVAGAVGCFIILLLAITMRYCYKRYVVKKLKNNVPSPYLIIAQTAFITEESSGNISLSKDDGSIEVYFPIEASLQDEPDEISSDLEQMIESWSIKSMPTMVGQIGSYCSKFEMDPYIKVGSEIS